MIVAPIDRRRLLAASAGLSALFLPGCATLGSRRALGCAPLAPVKVDESRVVRTVAGLRPYRAAGFVVRRDRLGDKALVHNYGHGGAGITLSWGSSKLAVDLGLAGHQGPVAVLGCGIMGLTTARLVQEAGFAVTIYAADLPPHTTSNVAGGQISPFGHYSERAVTDGWRAQFLAAMDYSWRRFQIMVGDDYGIRWLPTYNQVSGAPPAPGPLDSYHPASRLLGPAEHPFAIDRLARYETMYVETGRFLRQMMRDVQAAGGRIERRAFASADALGSLSETLIFNCTGLGAASLFGDDQLVPVRGQLAILLPQPEVDYAFTGDDGYMFPRADGILLGGTFERGQRDPTPDAAAIARILAAHGRIFDGFRCAA